jgi:hypothetical protein
MAENSIDKALASRRTRTESITPSGDEEGDKFFSILVGEPVQEHFLELRFQQGLRTCFAYSSLAWFNYDPESGSLDLDFGGYLVTVKGRGLGNRVFDGIRQRRVAWIKEVDSEMQDHKGNEVFIEAITISAPNVGYADEAAAA